MDAGARGLTQRGLATRERILVATTELIYEHGAAVTSLDDVMAAAAVSKSQLYHYFADKRALVLAVVQAQVDAVIAFQGFDERPLDTMPALRAWADRLVASARDSQGGRGCPIGRLAGQLAETDDEARGELERGFVRWHDGLAAGLRQMHDRGELAGDPDELATGLLAAVQGGLVLSQTARSAAPLATALRLALTAVAGWLTAPQSDAAKNRRRVAARVGG